MIGTSLPALIWIRVCIFVLRYLAPLEILGLVVLLVFEHDAHRLILLLEILSIAEVVFYVLVYIPRSRALQKPAAHPPLSSPQERRRLFNKGVSQVPDPEAYLTKWFNSAPLSEIRRDNVKEFFCWAFLNKAAWGVDDEQELDEYADKVEDMLGRKLPAGRGQAVPLRLTLDPINMQHRPLLWYIIISVVDCFVYVYMLASGFTLYRLRLGRFLAVFPFRVITLASRQVSSSDTLSYFYVPHTSKSRLPILFIHGVGVGMWPYTGFLRALHRSDAQAADGQTGIIALEIMALSSRITGTMPSHQQLTADMLAILDRHGWDRVELISHSYGSVITANMLRQTLLAARIGPMLMIDPVAFLLHLPDVAYNFTRRQPRQANERELYYFASTDMLIAETLARRFFWADNILWKEDLRGRNTTVVLGGKDIVAPTLTIGRYLSADEPGYERFLTEEEDDTDTMRRSQTDIGWQERPWRSEGVDVVWYQKCDHAEVFESRKDYQRLVDIARSYSAHGE